MLLRVEKEHLEWSSGMFCHKNAPGYMKGV